MIKIKTEYTFEVIREVEAPNYVEGVHLLQDNTCATGPRMHCQLPHDQYDYKMKAGPVMTKYSEFKRKPLSQAIRKFLKR